MITSTEAACLARYSAIPVVYGAIPVGSGQ